MKNLETLSTSELIILKSKIEKELALRENETTCIWSIRGEVKENPKPKEWEGEKYIY